MRVSLSECSGGDKNHISAPAHIASVYIKISLVLFVAASSCKLKSIQLQSHLEQQIFVEWFISRLGILCGTGTGMASIPCVCCISLSPSVLCLNSPNLPSSSVQVFTNFSLKQKLEQPPIFSVVILYLILDHWWKDWILGGSHALKFHFSMTTFLENRFVKSAIWLVIDALNVYMKMVKY